MAEHGSNGAIGPARARPPSRRNLATVEAEPRSFCWATLFALHGTIENTCLLWFASVVDMPSSYYPNISSATKHRTCQQHPDQLYPYSKERSTSMEGVSTGSVVVREWRWRPGAGFGFGSGALGV